MSPPFRSNLSELRRPIVVTMSIAAFTPCCKGNRQGAVPSDNTAVVASAGPTATGTAVAASTAGAKASVTASAPPPIDGTIKVWPFERETTVQNPRTGDKVVLFNGSTCFVFGEQDESTSGIELERHPVACPDGIDALLKNCIGGVLHRRGEQCECSVLEGNPPMPPRKVPCPEN